MRIAYFSDVHGNLHALEATLADIEKQAVDHVICGGDVINPLWTSREAVERILARGIPILRGNHEDYAWSVHFGEDAFAEDVRSTVKYWPVRAVAQRLGPEFSAQLRALPFDMVLEAREARRESRAYFCHGTPSINNRTPITGIDRDLANAYDATHAGVVVSGHWHLPWTQARVRANSGGAQLLVAAGSTGLSLRGSMCAEYVVLTYREDAGGPGWTAEHRSVRYDREAVVREYAESGALNEGGPIAWCLFDEFASGAPRLGPALTWLRETGRAPVSLEEWRRDMKAYLESVDRWEFVRTHV